MDICNKVKQLYTKDTKTGYTILKELEGLSNQSNQLYAYLVEFMSMLKSENYAIRLRGFRLLCLQAKWDDKKIIDENIQLILEALHDDKPTAIRQILQYMQFIIPYKKDLHNQIKEAVSSMDYSHFKDTMQPLIKKDIASLIALIQN